MKYSIILPVRNGGEYVKECVHSILAQTLNDFNLIVLDNCSTDGTREWIASLNDERIIIHPSSKSLSIEENWARIKDVEKNEYMTLIGHDDILKLDFLTVVDALIKKYPEAGLYHTHFDYINDKGNILRECLPMPERINASALLKMFLQNKINMMGTGYVMRSKDYDVVGGIPNYPNLLFADFELWLRLIKEKDFVISVANCFQFRIHQSMTTTSSDKKMVSAFYRFAKYLKELKTNPDLRKIIEDNASALLKFYCKGLTHRMLRTPLSERDNVKVGQVVDDFRKIGIELSGSNTFEPNSVFSIKIGNYIDSNFITRNMFLLFKKIFPKPILS